MKICNNYFIFSILTGGSDAKIKIWNIKTKQLMREIVGHKSPVGDMIVIENPFDLDQ
jgi:WD40 repeat protein